MLQKKNAFEANFFYFLVVSWVKKTFDGFDRHFIKISPPSRFQKGIGNIPEVFQETREQGFPRADYMRTENGRPEFVRDYNCFCFVVLTFLISVSMILVWGIYGSTTMQLGPNSSILIKSNPIFVEYVKVEELDSGDGPMLCGFSGSPILDVVTTWSEIHKTTLRANTHKDWIHFLNAGSHINISYNVNPPSSSSLVLVIAQGNEGLAQWIEDPSYPNTTLSWNIIHGNGTIQHHVSESSTYYIAVGNLNPETVEVHLNFRIKAFLYNTIGLYYKCTPAHSQCVFDLHFPSENSALLASPGRKSGMANGGWLVKLSYGPKWIIYISGLGGMTVLMLLMNCYLNRLQCGRQEQGRDQFGAMQSERNPLLLQKDSDLSSCSSSYDSVSQEDREYCNNMMRLCAICYDAPRDSFFLPCGHCVVCFACATRIAETVRKDTKEALNLVDDRKLGKRKAAVKADKKRGKKGKAAKKGPNKPKRPPSAFFVFLEELTKTFKKENPDKGISVSVGKAGGEKWLSMSAAEKAPYEAKAAKKKTEYESLMDAYNKKQESSADEGGEESERSKSEVHDEDDESGQEEEDEDEEEEEEEEEEDEDEEEEDDDDDDD